MRGRKRWERGKGGKGGVRRKYRVLKLKQEWTTSWVVGSCRGAAHLVWRSVCGAQPQAEKMLGFLRLDGESHKASTSSELAALGVPMFGTPAFCYDTVGG